MLTKKIAKYIQSLSYKKFRDEEKSFIAEGPKVVEEFLTTKKFNCEIIVAERDWLVNHQLLLSGMDPNMVFEVEPNRLQSISLLKTSNKVLGVFKQLSGNDAPPLAGKITLMLDDLQDPGNMGTIIRIADWFGIDQMVCSHNSVECYNPKVVQSTMGSLARVSIFYTDLFSFLQNNKGVSLYTAALEGDSVFEMGNIKKGVIMIGNESKGIHSELFQLATHKITIPRFGNAESLNAAVATGIILSHIAVKK
ncbi:MAG: RNA methyltransferase [Ginsengibacter sp.]